MKSSGLIPDSFRIMAALLLPAFFLFFSCRNDVQNKGKNSEVVEYDPFVSDDRYSGPGAEKEASSEADEFCLDKISESDLIENEGFRWFSKTDPIMEETQNEFFWIYKKGSSSRRLFFKCKGKFAELRETKNSMQDGGNNGIVDKYSENTLFENEALVIQISSVPANGPSTLWNCSLQVKNKQDGKFIHQAEYFGIDDSF